ncbi:hypothetical protein M378DRAFT_998670 [Amanita muscaria Koide BX008]|uniref:Uncharacterized protein n=1 Tax=Amanita muscaria (strain Koide BX008) TaxID=946122 RepID=A0A0C2SZQ6_AMAMK|nr:hypothetical protein M378DRAFT_998670 [Amanita muscaria Koide BX008]
MMHGTWSNSLIFDARHLLVRRIKPTTLVLGLTRFSKGVYSCILYSQVSGGVVGKGIRVVVDRKL